MSCRLTSSCECGGVDLEVCRDHREHEPSTQWTHWKQALYEALINEEVKFVGVDGRQWTPDQCQWRNVCLLKFIVYDTDRERIYTQDNSGNVFVFDLASNPIVCFS